MNDNDLEILEEYQSDNIYDLVHERKKCKALQNIQHKSSNNKKYYYLEQYANGKTDKREIAPGFLDAIELPKDGLIPQEIQRSDSLFYSTLPMVLNYEGGLVNNPKDKGGKTNMGITKGFLDTYKKKSGVKVDDVENLSQGDVVKLYKAEWDIFGFGKLDNTDVMKLIYDFSVNSGPKTAIKYLQQSLNKKGHNLQVDGYIGKKTNDAVNAVDEQWLKDEIQKARAEHYDSIVDNNSEQKEFIVGWFNRLNDIGRKYGTGIKLRSRHLK